MAQPAAPGALNVNITGTTGNLDVSHLNAQGTPGFNDFRLNHRQNALAELYQEQALVLNQPLNIDYLVPRNGGKVAGLSSLKIPTGSTIRSYLLHFDSPSGFGGAVGSVTFDQDIYAINDHFPDLNASDWLANGSNLWYKGGVRGALVDSATISSNKRTISINLNLYGYMDELRILFVGASGTPPADANQNGLYDCIETATGGTPLTLVNTDGDSVARLPRPG